MLTKRPNSLWRRLHAFLSVSLALFLVGIIATGTVCHGFRRGESESHASARRAATPSERGLETATADFKQARDTTIAALADYNATKARLDDYVNDQLTSRQSELQPNTQSIDDATQPNAESTNSEPDPQQLIARPAIETDQTNLRFHELQRQLMAAQQKCLAALDQQNAAWQRKVQLAANRAIAQRTTQLTAQSQKSLGAPLPETVLWFGAMAIAFGAIVGINATASELAFKAAADVRQALDLTILGLLPSSPDRVHRDSPRRESRWVTLCIRSAEFSLLAVVVAIAILAASDQQFFTKFLADPVAACNEKFWC